MFVIFRVKDRYVKCTRTDYQSSVCCDSCVEFFVQPKAGKGYFNFEVNAIGTLHLSYIEDPTRTPNGFVKFTRVPWNLGSSVSIYHSITGRVFPEIAEPVDWTVEYRVPFSLFEHFVGPIGAVSGQTWRANFYKCADKTSHPHWLT